VQHVSKNENTVANNLAQQALGFFIKSRKLYVLEKLDALVCQIGWSSFWPMQNAEIGSSEPSSAKSDGPVSKIGWSRIFRNSDNLGETTTVEPDDWQIPLIRYLENHGYITDKKFDGNL
jgi:hypothetical protein